MDDSRLDTLIIGSGISGLTVAHKLMTADPQHRLLVVDKGERAGGAIRSLSEDGYLAEIGPHGFLDNCEESRQILAETGLDKECVRASLKEFVRYVCIGGALKMIPQSPPKIIAAPLISPAAKLRVLGELFKSPLEGEPTVAQWAQYRFGKALLPYVDAVFTGTYAGDFEKLIIDAVMPGVRKLEKEHGSLIKGLIGKLRAAKKSGTPKRGMPAMTSFPNGLTRLVERLSEPLETSNALLLGATVDSFGREGDSWSVVINGKSYLTKNLCLALPVNSCLELIGANLADTVPPRIPEARILSIGFGFTAESSLPPGFGYLAPEQEDRFCLGALFSSNMFPGRAPEGHIFFEALIGGRRHPERLELDDETLIKNSLGDLRKLLDLNGDPVYSRVLRPDGGIPQLESGHLQLLDWREELAVREKGLYLHGFGWEGIGLNDMMKSGSRVAEAIIQGNSGDKESPEVKPVYF